MISVFGLQRATVLRRLATVHVFVTSGEGHDGGEQEARADRAAADAHG